MKKLGLLRHAKSDWGDSDKRDFDRGLNDRGRRGGRLMGRYIRENGPEFDLLLASPAERVKATLAAAQLGLEPVFDQRLYLASAETIIDVVSEKAGDADAVLVAAHNPGLQDMLLSLVAPDRENAHFDEAVVKYPTASFALLDLPIDDWGALGGQDGAIADFRRPRDLDPELGPVD
tara:strand:- start:65 stop:592 length:528 start_codon:yes stop_codon:yes gene_type:complete